MATITPSQSNILCVICHQPINITHFGAGRVILEQNYVGCPNGHLLHRDCLKKWIVNSKDCPVCHEKYDLHIIQIYSEYLEQLEADRRQALEQKKQQEAQAAQDKVKTPVDPVFEEEMQKIEQLALKEDYTTAMNLLWIIIDSKRFAEKDPRYLRTLLNLSLVYYRMGKYALAIRQLMNLVKIDFDYPLAFYYLGLSYEQVDLPDKSRWAFERALTNCKKLAEKDPQYQSYIVDIMDRMKKNPMCKA